MVSSSQRNLKNFRHLLTLSSSGLLFVILIEQKQWQNKRIKADIRSEISQIRIHFHQYLLPKLVGNQNSCNYLYFWFVKNNFKPIHCNLRWICKKSFYNKRDLVENDNLFVKLFLINCTNNWNRSYMSNTLGHKSSVCLFKIWLTKKDVKNYNKSWFK